MHGTGRGVIEISSRPEMNSSKVKSVLAPNSPIIAHLWVGSKWPWTHKMRTPFLLPKLLGEGRGIRMHQTGEGALADPMVRHGMGSMTAMGSRHWLHTFVNCNNFESKFQCKVSAKYSDTSFPILLSETGSSFMEKFASCRKACMRSSSPENTERIER